MCLNKQPIRLKNGRIMYVNCGHCSACQQEKANRRTALIRNESKPGYITLFVTLTYDNRFLPYIKKSDLNEAIFEDRPTIPVYRHAAIRRVRSAGSRYVNKIKINGEIDKVSLDISEDFDFSQLVGYRYVARSSAGVRWYNNHDDKVSIIYYKDLQNFYKQLKIRYARTYGKELEFSSFHVAEYGPTTLRAHFHSLITIKQEDEERVRNTILEAWRFCDRKRLQEYIEIAKDAASYVSSYVNSSTYLPQVYLSKDIRPKSSHTKHYGFGNPAFSLGSVLEKVDAGDLHYDVSFRCKDAVYVHSFLIPRYVISNYFPKIKGFSKLTTEQLSSIYAYPPELANYAKRLGYDSHSRIEENKGTSFLQRFSKFSLCNPPSRSPFLAESYVRDCRHRYVSEHRAFYEEESKSVIDYVTNVRMLKNAFTRFCRDYKDTYGYYPTTDLYAYYATRVWSVYGSNLIKDSYLIPEDSRYIDDSNANNNPYDVSRDYRLVLKYDKYDKSKKIYSNIYSLFCANF